MSEGFTKDDLAFLRRMGVRVEPALDEDCEDAATPDPVLNFLGEHRLAVNRQNYLAIAYLGIRRRN